MANRHLFSKPRKTHFTYSCSITPGSTRPANSNDFHFRPSALHGRLFSARVRGGKFWDKARDDTSWVFGVFLYVYFRRIGITDGLLFQDTSVFCLSLSFRMQQNVEESVTQPV